jgi:hypothetical protein
MTRLSAALGGLLGRAPEVTCRHSGPTVPFATHLKGGAAGNQAPISGAAPHPPPRKGAGPDARREDDALDPLTRHAAQLAPPSMLAPPPPPPLPGAVADPGGAPALRAMTSLEEILPQLVRRLSMTGDGRRGAIRVEIGAGALAGSTLLVSAEDGRLRVELSAPSTVDAASWRDRIATRLAARGLVVDDIVVKSA